MKILFKKALELIQIFKYKLSLDRKSQIIRFIKKSQPLSILEIGVHKGEFAIRMLKAINAVNHKSLIYFGIDLFSEFHSEQINKTEISLWPDSFDAVNKKMNLEFPTTKIFLMQGDSISQMQQLQGMKFDLIFIDGGHSYKTVKSDWLLSQRLISDKGTIFFDDHCSEKNSRSMGFGIKKVIDEIERDNWSIKKLPINDYFLKDWGVLRIGLVKVSKILRDE